MQDAKMNEKLDRLKKNRLAKECAKLDPQIQKAMAEEGLIEDMRKWPPY